MCGQEIASEHEHLVEPANRKLVCSCEACAILFQNHDGSKYKRVPKRVVFLPQFQMTDAEWEALMIPIEMAFFFKSSPQAKISVFYPSPAGPTESLLSLNAWTEIEDRNPILQEMEADTMALLVNRVGPARGASPAEYYLAPIDECYKLVGLIRTHWRGFSGGAEVWRELAVFFSALKKRAGYPERTANA